MLCGLRTDRQTRREECCVVCRQTDEGGGILYGLQTDRRGGKNAVWFADRQTDERGGILPALQTDRQTDRKTREEECCVVRRQRDGETKEEECCVVCQARPTLTETLAVSTPRDLRPRSPALTQVRLQCLARAVAARGTVAHVRDARPVDMARAAKVKALA